MIDLDYVEQANPLALDHFELYEPTSTKKEKFQFGDRVTTTYYCSSRHISNLEETNGILARKVIELDKNDIPNRVFTIIERTRLHTGNLRADFEYSEMGGKIMGSNYLETEHCYTVYVLSDGFGSRYRALPDHMSCIVDAPDPTEPTQAEGGSLSCLDG